MNEFALIDLFFKTPALSRPDVVCGIGDDAACLSLPPNQQLVVSTDTLLVDVHFLMSWDAYDIASKAILINVSDIAAMAAQPCWLTLALTLPKLDQVWLARFSQGLHESLKQFAIALVGGDITQGPLSITPTILGLVPAGKALRRSGARPGDKIYLSGELGAAALAVSFLQTFECSEEERQVLMQKLLHPRPRVDLADILRACASAAIDISDGLSADLNHICLASGVGACLNESAIPVHPLVEKYQAENAVHFALSGGDDYELCFTVSPQKEKKLLTLLAETGLDCYPIGCIEEKKGLRLIKKTGELCELAPLGYRHF